MQSIEQLIRKTLMRLGILPGWFSGDNARFVSGRLRSTGVRVPLPAPLNLLKLVELSNYQRNPWQGVNQFKQMILIAG